MLLFGSLVCSVALARDPLPPQALVMPPAEAIGARLTIKFVDGARARTTGDQVRLTGQPNEQAALDRITTDHALRFQQLLDLSDDRIIALEERAQQRGRQTADLRGMMAIEVPNGDLIGVGNALQDLDVVEYAFIQALGTPPPGDISPTSSDLTSYQDYTGPDPGIDVEAAWALGATGANIRLSDCEYGWVETHEDLMDRDLNPEPGQTPVADVATYEWDEHGLGVMGVTSAVDNGYGMTGMVTDAVSATYPEWTNEGGWRRSSAIASAIADSAAGDVVMLEMQSSGSGGYAPAEYDPSVWTVVEAGTAAGVIVVGAAGNGNQNLDGSSYSTYLGYGDSGSIIVGAGSADTSHDKLSFSTYGSRVDLQGWGWSVATLGYGDLARYGSDDDQAYTSSFNGTSSATPVVSSAVVAVQDWTVNTFGVVLDPFIMRDLLVDTGIPQGSGGSIGPFPDVAAAILALDSDEDLAMSSTYGGDDCDDTDPDAYLGATEIWYDGIDQDCLGGDDFDQDGDGFQHEDHGGTDCDDTNADAHPDIEIDEPYDGVDADCDGASDFDADGDGHDSSTHGGTDCNDDDNAISPDAIDLPYDGEDTNCDGLSDFDADGDGVDSNAYGGTDCNDEDAGISPNAKEVWYDGTDQDCDGGSDFDADGDGEDAMDYGGKDCDDGDPEVVDCDDVKPKDTGDPDTGVDDTGVNDTGVDDTGTGPTDTGTNTPEDTGTPVDPGGSDSPEGEGSVDGDTTDKKKGCSAVNQAPAALWVMGLLMLARRTA